MGSVRARQFDAVIGVGGIGAEPRSVGIAGKVNWIGIGPRRHPGIRGPIISFDRFKDFGTAGPDLVAIAPALADRIYGRNVRSMMHTIVQRRDEVTRILELAESSPASLKRSGRVGACSFGEAMPRCPKPRCPKQVC